MMLENLRQHVVGVRRVGRARRGMALLVVLVLTVLIAIAAYEFTFYMESQYRASRVHEEQAQARLAALSGVEVAAALLELPPADRLDQGGLLDNDQWFSEILVETPLSFDKSTTEETTAGLWRCSLISPAAGQSQSLSAKTSLQGSGENASEIPAESLVRFGLINESSKLHIPTLLAWDQIFPGHAEAALGNLPGADQRVVKAWLQALRKNLSSQLEQSSLQARREQIDTAETTRDVIRETIEALWFGQDLNRNYRLDPLEVQLAALANSKRVSGLGSSVATPSAVYSQSTGSDVLLGGWSDYLSWHNGQRNRSFIGRPRVNLNQDDLQQLHKELLAIWPSEWANFVVAYRQHGPAINLSSESASKAASDGQWIVDFGRSPQFSLTSPLDLVDAYVSVGKADENAASSGSQANVDLLQSPFQTAAGDSSSGIHDLLDEATTVASPTVQGRIDISAASLPVLQGIPGVDTAMAQRIIESRKSLASSPERLSTVAWLLDGSNLTLEELLSIEPYITGRSDIYSFQVVGFRDSKSPVFRATVTLNATANSASMQSIESWHSWGNGFSVAELVADQ